MESLQNQTNVNNNTPNTQEAEKAPKHISVDNYVSVFSHEFLHTLETKLNALFKSLNIPTAENENSYIIYPKHSPNQTTCALDFQEYRNLKSLSDQYTNESIADSAKLNYLIDLQNFYTTKEDASDIQFHSEIFKSQLQKTKDKGYNLFLMDYHHLKQLAQNLESYHSDKNGTTNVLSKMYIIERTPIAALVLLQKFENNKNDFAKAKILNHEMYEDLTITRSVQINYSDLNKSLTYMNEMYQYQAFLRHLHSGEVLNINIRENYWSDNVDFTFTICDSNDEELLNKKICKAIIVSKIYSRDFLYLSPEGNQTLCKQVEASRIILIRQNSFNVDSIAQLKEKLHHLILFFKFDDSVNESIPIMLMSESRDDSATVFENNKILIRDTVEAEKKDTYRQLIFKENASEIQTEIKLHLTSRTNLNKNPEDYSPVYTLDKFKQKNLVNTLDEEFVSSFYIKSILSGMFFVRSDDFPQKNFEILILGAGCGTVNHFFRKIFGDKVNIDSVELDKEFKEIGSKYFGFKNDSKNFNWFFQNALEFVKNSEADNKYDMIIIDINNFNQAEGISPPPQFYDEEFLNKLNKMVKETGIYIINLMARNFKLYGNALSSLEKVFELIFLVENNEDLNKIHYCFKKKYDNQYYLANYQINFDKYSQAADLRIIQNDYKKILSRVSDINDFKTEIKKNI